MKTEYSGTETVDLLALVDTTLAVYGTRTDTCTTFWPINDGHDVEKCQKQAVTFCADCETPICRDCAQVCCMEPRCLGCDMSHTCAIVAVQRMDS